MRRACKVVRISRSNYYYSSIRDDRALRQRILEIEEMRCGMDTNACMCCLDIRAGK